LSRRCLHSNALYCTSRKDILEKHGAITALNEWPATVMVDLSRRWLHSNALYCTSFCQRLLIHRRSSMVDLSRRCLHSNALYCTSRNDILERHGAITALNEWPATVSGIQAIPENTPDALLGGKSLNLARLEKLTVLKTPPVGISPQQFDYFLALDFECTCRHRSEGQMTPCQEIIEFPVLKINARNFQVESKFHQYVRPTLQSVLTQFCTDLTGITQAMVDGQPTLPETLHLFNDWLIRERLIGITRGPQPKWMFITDGDMDLGKFLARNVAELGGIELPEYFTRWIDLRLSFFDAYQREGRLTTMLGTLGIQRTGRLHSGLDDVMNMSKAMKMIAENSGYVFKQTKFTEQLIPMAVRKATTGLDPRRKNFLKPK